MGINDLILNVKSGRLKDCVKLPKTEEEKIELLKLEYPCFITEVEWNKRFPNIDASHILLTRNIASQVLYVDYSKMILIELKMYCTYDNGNAKLAVMKLDDSATEEETLLKQITIFEQMYERNEIEKIFFLMPDAYKLDMFATCIERIPKDIIYDLFIEIYSFVDYGFGNLTIDTMRLVIAAKSEEEKEETEKKLASFAEVVTVFRGDGNHNSSSLKMSYTLNKNIANFFACKNTSLSASITEAKVKKCDIIEYMNGRNEEEVLLFPSTLFDVKTIPLISMTDTLSNEIINIIQKDIQEMRNLIKETYDSVRPGGHDGKHVYRVTFLAMYLAIMMKIPKKLFNAIRYAAAFHDIGRTNDAEDTIHGLESVKIAKKYFPKESIALVSFLVEYHCKDDKEYLDYIKAEIPKEKQEDYLTCIQILKDADALDRVRFGIKDLDINYLRTSEAKKMTLLAQQALNGLKL